MRTILTGFDNLIGSWISRTNGGRWIPGSGPAIGLLNEQGSLVAGIAFTNYTGSHMWLEAASDGSRFFLTREFIRFSFHYAFNQAGCSRVSLQTCDLNKAAIRFCEKVGFKQIARLEDAHFGNALIVYSMHKDECKWIKEDHDIESTSSAAAA